MSFLRWMTIHSFHVLNPDWKVVLHLAHESGAPSWPTGHNKQVSTKDYRTLPFDKGDWLEIRPADPKFGSLHGVQQSDILRNRYLSEEGGVWSDMDILYYRPMHMLNVNKPENDEAHTGLCYQGDWFPIGFMMAAPGSAYFAMVHERQVKMFDGGAGRSGYQGYGTGLYKAVKSHMNPMHFVIGPQEVYQHKWSAHARIFAGDIALDRGVGIHWYGGSDSAAAHESNINHESWHEHPLRPVIACTYPFSP